MEKENTAAESVREPVVMLENVEISIDEDVSLRGVNLRLEAGEFVYLIGKSGTGKTSVLRALYGERRIESGVARVCDVDMVRLRRSRIPRLRRQLGIVFQDTRLLEDRNVYSNLEFVLRATGWKSRKEIRAQIEKVLASVGLADKWDAMPRRLSVGEGQRVGIARALINNPKLVLADEPTGNLDPVTSAEVMQLLVDVGRETGTTMLVSTHDFMTIERFPARVVVCEGGTLAET